MAFQIFKKSEKGKERQIPKAKAPEVKEKEKAPELPTKAKKYSSDVEVLLAPRITEKASMLEEIGQYTFLVSLHATKSQIQKAVSDMYGVSVKRVRVIRIPARKVRVGRIEGMKGAFKKAMVKLQEGQKIELLSR